MIRLYDLAGADDRVRFSPNCWRIRMALAHKQLPVETIAWRFCEKAAIGFSGQGKVPVLVDGDHCIVDSWAIAEYLERNYADRPLLFGGEQGVCLARFINHWTSQTLHSLIARLIIPDLVEILHPQDRDYFRSSREAAFGQSFAQLVLARDENLQKLHALLQPLESSLTQQEFLGGVAPHYADHIVFGAFQWARVASPMDLLTPHQAVLAWRERMLDAYGGLGRLMPQAGEEQNML